MRNSRKIVYITALLLCTCGMTVFAFIESLLFYFAPKMLLAASLPDMIEQLNTHFEADPVRKILDDAEGGYMIETDLDFSLDSSEKLSLTFDIQTDAKHKCVCAKGGIVVPNTPMIELDFYMDTECMTMTVPEILPRGSYGITFATFLTDIKQIPLLPLLIEDTMFTHWNDYLQKLQRAICMDIPLNNIHTPELREEDIQNLIAALITLPCEVEARTIALENEAMKCRTLTYCISEEQMKEGLGTEMSATISFYLGRNRLVQIDGTLLSGDGTPEYIFKLKTNPDNCCIEVKATSDDEKKLDQSFLFASDVQTDGRHYRSWNLSQGKQEFTFKYKWNPLNKSMDIIFKDGSIASLKCSYPEGKLMVQSDQLAEIMNGFGINMKLLVEGTISLRALNGEQIEAPEYINLDQWTLSEFLAIVEKITELTGWHWNIATK